MKANFLGGQQHRYLCLNEAVCAQVAYRIQVNVPEFAILELTSAQLGSYSADAPPSQCFTFASKVIEPAEPLSPETAAEASPAEAAGITVLDALVRNTDRKPEHILAEPLEQDAWRLWAIDHGHTLATADTLHGNFAPDQPASPPLDLLREHITWVDLEPWIDRAQAIPRLDYKKMVDRLPGPWVVEPDAAETIADVLFQRATELPQLLAAQMPR